MVIQGSEGSWFNSRFIHGSLSSVVKQDTGPLTAPDVQGGLRHSVNLLSVCKWPNVECEVIEKALRRSMIKIYQQIWFEEAYMLKMIFIFTCVLFLLMSLFGKARLHQEGKYDLKSAASHTCSPEAPWAPHQLRLDLHIK